MRARESLDHLTGLETVEANGTGVLVPFFLRCRVRALLGLLVLEGWNRIDDILDLFRRLQRHSVFVNRLFISILVTVFKVILLLREELVVLLKLAI